MKILLALLLVTANFVQAQNTYLYKADIQHIENDKIAIALTTPAIKEDEIVFTFPKVIPGSYSEKNFGKFIDDFTAKDKAGNKLKVKKLNPNQYQISDATTLQSITYEVNDTWDKPDKDFIFQPGGTNIEAGSNVVMNNHAFYGYFEGYKKLPIQVEVTKPANMYASTHMQVDHKSSEQDILQAPDYVYLVDNPVMYTIPDTTSFAIGNSVIHITSFSATGKVTSKQLATYLMPVAESLNKFFGGLPVSSYQFLFYFDDLDKMGKKNMGGGFGALEHNYSSLYYLPEVAYEPRLKSLVLEVVSHEFLHILTPLNLHSEEIDDFDFINPKMSKHLWLYEGVTEYFANLTQVQNGLLTEKKFFESIRKKINDAADFGNFSMTTMSEHVLESPYKEKYNSVYSKGAIIAMMLDILIRNKTEGAKDLKSVIMTLTKKYGPGKPFKDNHFFQDFVAASHPAVQGFIDDYIVGEKPLPYQDFFAEIGYEFDDVKKMDAYFVFKSAGLEFNQPNQAFVFTNVDKKNALDIKNGDELVSIEGNAITSANLEPLWEEYIEKNTSHPKLRITIRRKGEEKELSGELFKGYIESKNYIAPLTVPTATQDKLLYQLIHLTKDAG